MRSIREIFARAVILQCFDDRIVLEMNRGEFTRPIKEREDERILMRNWLGDKGYDPYMTNEERAFFELPVGEKSYKKNELEMMDVRCKAMDIKEEEFYVHELATDPLVNEAREAIKKELDIPIPMLGKDEWKAERKKAVKKILTDLQTKLMEAKATQKEEILRAGKALYKQTKKDIADKIEQNRILHEANEKLTAENTRLKEKLASVDETAVRKLQAECESANRRAERADRIATGERRRASDAEEKVHDMLAIPEIKEIWETIRRNKESFQRQINQWITDATKAISDFAKDYDKYLFSQDDESVIGSGIIAEAYMCGLDPTDKDQRTQATESLLGKVNWKGTTPFMSDLAATRTKQLSEEMSVPREIMEGLMLAAGGRGGANIGGGGSNNELTNWDGTKRNNGWGRNR